MGRGVGTDYKKHWERIKKEFESAAKTKKPAEKVWGFFRRPSGIAAALEAFDKAETCEAAQKAFKKAEKLIDDYRGQLGALLKTVPSDHPVADALDKMIDELLKLIASVRSNAHYFVSLAEREEEALRKCPPHLKALEKSRAYPDFASRYKRLTEDAKRGEVWDSSNRVKYTQVLEKQLVEAVAKWKAMPGKLRTRLDKLEAQLKKLEGSRPYATLKSSFQGLESEVKSGQYDDAERSIDRFEDALAKAIKSVK